MSSKAAPSPSASGARLFDARSGAARIARAGASIALLTSLWSIDLEPACAQGAAGKPAAKGAPAAKPAPAPDPKDKARELYKQGAKAIEDGKHAEGLALLEQAEALFHAPTHLLLIAKAQAQLGRLVDARATYQRLAEEELAASASGTFKDAKATAKSELQLLDKRLPKLRLVTEPADAAGLSVTMNTAPVPAERLSAPFAVDPGTYVFVARADGMESARVTVEAAERTATDVRLVLFPIGAKKPPPAPVVSEPGWPPMKIAGVSLIAVGGAALAAGGAFGILHFTTKSSADDRFAECGASCRQDVEALDADAALFGNISIGALAGGAALLGAGVVLFVLAPATPTDEAAGASGAATLGVRVSPSGAHVHGTF